MESHNLLGGLMVNAAQGIFNILCIILQFASGAHIDASEFLFLVAPGLTFEDPARAAILSAFGTSGLKSSSFIVSIWPTCLR